MTPALEQVTPLLVGIQTGTLIGHLAKESIARYDLPIPRDDDNRLFFIASNVERLARDYSFDHETFRRWLALHEAARHLVTMSVPWVTRFWRGLLVELVDAIEIDVGDVERRLMDLQRSGMEALQEGMGAEAALPIVETERHRRALDRLRAFVAAFDGYAIHAAAAVTGEVVGDAAKIDEGMARHKASPSDGKAMLSGVLGLSLDRALETAGTTFCAAVVQLKGIASLNEVWAAPDNLPTIEEIKDPFAWIERVLAA